MSTAAAAARPVTLATPRPPRAHRAALDLRPPRPLLTLAEAVRRIELEDASRG